MLASLAMQLFCACGDPAVKVSNREPICRRCADLERKMRKHTHPEQQCFCGVKAREPAPRRLPEYTISEAPIAGETLRLLNSMLEGK